ncbi:hypothetical protein EON65_43605 [archaeon]|nr:MAG: hypothetical protein EON65_43605 [archaeon]
MQSLHSAATRHIIAASLALRSILVNSKREMIPRNIFLSVFFAVAALFFSGRGFDWVVDPADISNSYLLNYKHHPLRHGLSPSYMSFLRNKTVVFIGDSLTRYQYLSLALFLHHACWQDDWGLPSLAHERQFSGWLNFFHETNLRLGCAHVCDCVRTEEVRHENRYFYHVGLNFSMSVFFFAPDRSTTFYLDHHPTRDEIYKNCVNETSSLAHMMSILHPHNVHRLYDITNITDFIRTEVKAMQPDAVFFNQGIWKPRRFRHTDNLQKLAMALKEATRYPFWKVTTAAMVGGPRDSVDFLHTLKSLDLGIYDTYNLTKGLIPLREQVFWDTKYHFTSFVYREANLALLELMRVLFSPCLNESKFQLAGELPVDQMKIPCS